jgi:flavin-dependent dehydrogenase
LKADVAIYGAGPAGCALALELAHLGRTVVMVTRDDAESARTFGECLPPTANPVLSRLQLPPPNPEHHLPSFGNESSWGREDVRSNDFIFNPYGAGWHLDRARFDASLREAVQAMGIPILAEPHNARWIADCTGRGSAVARKMGARLQGADRLVAFAAMARSQEVGDVDSATLTESVAGGWWYTARLTDRRRVVAFHTDGDLPACQAARHRDGFHELLEQTQHIRIRMSGYVIPEGFPVPLVAGGRWLDKAFGDGWIAVGDAAQCYDPLSSQGLVKALESAVRAAFALHAALDGDFRHLRRYQTMLELQRLRYERLRSQYYGFEQRWPDSLYWRRRHDASEARHRPDRTAGGAGGFFAQRSTGG